MQDKAIIALLLSVVLLGTVGYSLAGDGVYASLVSSVSALVVNLPTEPSNTFIEASRWLGVLFSLGVIYVIVKTSASRSAAMVRLRLRVRRSDAIAVHGEGPLVAAFLEDAGNGAFRSEHPIAFEAPIQVVLFPSDKETLAYLGAHSHELAKAREVYVGLEVAQGIVNPESNVFLFSFPEMCARMYWQDYPVNEKETISIIGEGTFAEALLTQGLLVNLFSTEGGVRYRMYGGFEEYSHTHCLLDEAVACGGDELVLSKRCWYEDLDAIRKSDRIILCESEEDNLRISSELRSIGFLQSLHLRCDNPLLADLFEDDKATTVFGTIDKMCTHALIIRQQQHDSGKICDVAYRAGTSACNYCTRQIDYPEEAIVASSAEEDRRRIKVRRLESIDFERCLGCDRFLEDWRKKDDFTRRSNYAVADHDAHKIRLMKAAGADRPGLFDGLPLEKRDELQEIEHIRWCRFHFLNGWRHADSPKDSEKRTHPFLLPYKNLPRAIKDYDGDSYRTLYYRTKRRSFQTGANGE